MDSDLAVRRRAVAILYRRYLDAERAWNEAVREAASWFPAPSRPRPGAIGAPRSPLRRLHERRERAVAQLEVAVLKLKVARRRRAERRAIGIRFLPLR
jgi:hypothetical protein